MAKKSVILDNSVMSKRLETAIYWEIPTVESAVKISDFKGNVITLNRDQMDNLCKNWREINEND